MRSEKVPFDELAAADLVLDRVYSGGTQGHAGDDAIGKLLPVGNQGGFRPKGSVIKDAVRLVALYTSGAEVDWPDHIDPTTGDFTYYGDNRKPGKDLHDTPRGGNLLLRSIFAASRAGADDRQKVPPLFLFEKVSGRDVIFRGLLAPGSPRLTSDEELVAIWRTTRDLRFQNYRSHFTVLQTPVVRREWIDEIVAGDPLGGACPPEWRNWVKARIYQALEAPRNLIVRSKEEQLPRPGDMWMIRAVHRYFAQSPVEFEHFAADMWLNSDPHVASVEVTRPSRDGGRDAIGEFRIGPDDDPVRLQFALEAKCYNPDGGGIGVKLVSRLIARIKQREFGIFVTTAFIAAQAYQEVREDQHPIIFMTGRDLVKVMRRMGMSDDKVLATYLSTQHPLAPAVHQMGTGDVAWPKDPMAVDSAPATHGTQEDIVDEATFGGGLK
ncbi:restriction endonuclease [Mycolicibacterium arabiense]|uniref:restriction endonuclease n=1 Tax=Mycolicibacterium arabiense TaxID=1286181 RepID=UPI0018DFF70B|nr:restriction endonuclease [Mycolicibacterium arabiense]